MRELLDQNLADHGLADRVEVVTSLADLAGVSFDYVTCLGVLEHLPLDDRYSFYGILDASLSSHGHTLIDVPIEIGVPVLIKECGRQFLKGDERNYSYRELANAALGRAVFDPVRFRPADHSFIVHHKGFDYRLLEKELAGRFQITATETSPFRNLPTWSLNQELFITIQRVNHE